MSAIKNEIANLFDLTGKTAIVTGGAKGIGEGISALLADAGAKVVICDLNTDNMEKTVNKLTEKPGAAVSGVPADISAEEDCINVVKKTITLYGGVDILVNNAGYFPTIPLLETTQEDWDKVFAVNCRGAFLMTRETVKAMAAQNQSRPGRGGSIIFFASVGAFRTNRGNMSAYHSSKGAILSLKNELAAELAPHGIRVNCVLPGAINSMSLDENGEYKIMPMPIDKVPLCRLGLPGDIANAVLYLASPAAQYVTGIELIVDGGLCKLPTYGYSDEIKISRMNG
jgi:NAD(P)-dependent dehydrogenase (short-subunit alcohol dehydrogenase family)